LKLITFDGDVTLYPDGSILESNNPVIPYLIDLLSQDIHIGIVTAAGYPNKHGKEYTRRLSGLLDTIAKSPLTCQQKENLAILGGECNYLFRYNDTTNKLEWVEQNIWILEEMKNWEMSDINLLLDIAEGVLNNCVKTMSLNVNIIRKPRAVGTSLGGYW
jgi:IMP and pyridine-specific 5'-nucleotidase